jgi:hypothetical protein
MGIIAGSRLRAAGINPLFANAVAYYKFDETTGDAIDSVNGYNGTLFGTITRGVTGKIGNAYQFQSNVDDIIFTQNPTDFTFVENDEDIPFTFRCWLKTASTGTQMIFGKAKGEAAEYYFRIRNGKIQLQLFSETNGSIKLTTVSTSNVITGEFVHIAITYDGNKNAKIYQNAINLSTSVTDNGYVKMERTTTSNLISRNNFASGQNIDGKLDELCIIRNQEWTAAQVTEDYNGGAGTTI